MKRLVLSALLALLAWPAQANAAVPYVPVVPGISVVVGGPCPDQWDAGCTTLGEDTVHILEAGDQVTLYHELGHQFAFRVLNDIGSPMSGGMRKFARLTRRRHSGGRWVSDVREQFADAYAACALGEHPEPGEWGDRGDYFPTGNEYDPTPGVHRQVCTMIVRAAARRGLT